MELKNLNNDDMCSKMPLPISMLLKNFMASHQTLADLSGDLFQLCNDVYNLAISSFEANIITSKLSVIEDKIDHLSSIPNTQPKTTYAQSVKNKNLDSKIVRNEPIVPNDTRVLLIYPNTASTEQTSVLSLEVIKNLLNRETNFFGISRLHKIKKGGVLIEVRNDNELEKLKHLIKANLQDIVIFADPQLRNPELRIKNIEKGLEDVGIIPLLCKQNNIEENLASNILSCKVITTRFGRLDAVLEVRNPLFNNLLSRGKIYLGYSRLNITQNVYIKSCLNCYNTGHIKNKCPLKDKIYCKNCGANHKINECKSTVQNCWRCSAYSHIKTSPHRFGSENCILYQREYKKLIEITNFNDL